MADNVNVTPGTGATLAADDIGGILYPRQKLTIGADGVDGGDVSASNPLPVTGTFFQATQPVSAASLPLPTGAASQESVAELVDAIQALRMAVQALNRSIGQMMPDTANRMRVNVEAGTLPTVTTVGTVSTMTNQTQIGGLAATEQIPSLMRLGADSARRNILVT
jgi:hypothetical protein